MLKRSRTLNTIFLAASNFCNVFTTIGIAALLSRFLTIDEYATYRQALLCFQAIEPILGLGLPIGILYFAANDQKKFRSTTHKCILMLTVSGLTYAVLISTFGNNLISQVFNNPRLQKTLLIFSTYPTLYLLTTFLKSFLASNKRPELTAIFTILESSLRIASISVIIIYFNKSANASIQGMLISGLLALIIGSLFYIKFRPARATTDTNASYQEILRHSLPISLGVAIEAISKNIDKIIVSTQFPPDTFAIFVNGAVEIPVIGIITGSIATILTPEITTYFKHGKKRLAIQLFQSGAKKSSIIIIPTAGAMYLFSEELMTFLYGSEFIESSIYFKIYLTTSPLRVILYSILFQAAGETGIILKRAIASLIINTLLSIALTKAIGPAGAAVGTVLTVTLFATPYCLYYCTKKYDCRIIDLVPADIILLCTLTTITATATASFLSAHQSAQLNLSIISKGIIYTATYLAIAFPLRNKLIYPARISLKNTAGRAGPAQNTSNHPDTER